MQRNVEVRVTDMDKNGVALGFLFVGQGASRHSFAEDILQVRSLGGSSVSCCWCPLLFCAMRFGSVLFCELREDGSLKPRR